MNAVSLIRNAEPTQTPWRFRFDETRWCTLIHVLEKDPLLLMGLWCDGQDIHAVFLDEGQPIVATLALENGRYPALSPVREVASFDERIICDLYGVEVMGALDDRPLLDHNMWQVSMPMGRRLQFNENHKGLPHFYPSDQFFQGAELLEGWGPATGNMDPPFHVSVALRCGYILRAESQMGYTHRGLALRWCHSSIKEACRLSARVSAGVSVAHQVAFCMAVENAYGICVAPDISLIRVALLELERIIHHLYKLAILAHLMGADLIAHRCMSLREDILEAQIPITGSRLLVDVCLPGTVTLPNVCRIGELCYKLYINIYEKIISLENTWRVYPGLVTRLMSLGSISREEVVQFGVEGPVARASGKEEDQRKMMPSYAGLWRYSSVQRQGTGNDRSLVLFNEVTESLRMLGMLADPLNTSSVIKDMGYWGEKGEGIAVVEGPWGPVLYWVQLSQGYVSHVFQRGSEKAIQLLFERSLQNHTMDKIPLLACSLGVNAAAFDL